MANQKETGYRGCNIHGSVFRPNSLRRVSAVKELDRKDQRIKELEAELEKAKADG